jgi:hypothetical protein
VSRSLSNFPQLPDRAVLIRWRQGNIVIGRKGHARLTEYGLGPIIFQPGGASGNSRWLAPECTRKGADTPATESYPTDVFAFAMVAVEVFTDKVLFSEEQNDSAAVRRILNGDRPGKPDNAQGVGLTDAMWELLTRCWSDTRPNMDEVVETWDKSINNGCVQVTRVIQTSPSLPFSPFCDQLRDKPQEKNWFCGLF